LGKLRFGFKWCIGSATSLWRVWRHRRTIDAVYVPYPALLPLLLFRVIPRRWRPRLICDAFISVWESLVLDRKVWPRNSLRSKLLFLLEKTALRAADVVRVDTQANRGFIADMFNIPVAKIQSTPLVIDEEAFAPWPPKIPGDICKVLYIGTFVPLHGVEVVCEAIRRLPREKFEFTLAGDGQDAAALERLIGVDRQPNVRWLRGWASSTELAGLIGDADICLGIFGTTAKASRVFPFKNYLYSRCGRPIVSAIPCGFPGESPREIPFVSVDAGNPAALADALQRLAEDPALRERFATRSAAYYSEALGTHLAIGKLADAIDARP
jgi:glycosyltransferase involved in cell wall biosynthesis